VAGGVASISVTSDERWLAANWPFVRAWLPATPAQVVEVGCGLLGGFVPMMGAAGLPGDRCRPRGPAYRQVEFERSGVHGARLTGPDDLGWPHQRQAEWRESGKPGDAYLESWVHAEGLHAGSLPRC